MVLEEYQRKRHFAKTPEPTGKTPTGRPGGRFVIQKHAASRLHYDLRLEHAGVLKSWAVPKGPSRDPEHKRLAVMVEDHPIDYIDFEGVIPEGEYGAGQVIVWDKGTYSWAGPEKSGPQQAEAFAAGLAKGHLSVVLEGEKLTGEFALVRVARGGRNAWLLIKAHDSGAAENDVLALDKSVVSGKRIEEIGGLSLYGAPQGPLPDHLIPMMATLVSRPFDRKGWLFEVKYDGYRAVGQVNEKKVRLYSRAGHSLNDRFAPLVKQLEGLGHNAVVDGEVVVLDSDGRPSFQLLQDYLRDGRGELVYYVFDILWLDGHDLKELPLLDRKAILAQILPKNSLIAFAEHVESSGLAFFKAAAKAGLEGVVAKDGASHYRPGERGHRWLKIKARLSQEFVIGGYTAPQGSRKHFGSLLVGFYRRDDFVFAGHVGTGFDEAMLTNLSRELATRAITTCPFVAEPAVNAPATWVKPELVAEVEFAEWTQNGLLRQPSYMGLRDDKNPRDVVAENIALGFQAAVSDPAEPTDAPTQTVRRTNPAKLYWPDDGITKGDMIDYYRAMAPYILPHLAGYPQSLHRFPNGLADVGFWQKNAGEDTPGWVETIAITSAEESKTVNYILCGDERTLLYLANLGCIEMNPWLSRVGRLDNPDFAVIDLDPLDVPFSAVLETALTIHEVLHQADVKPYIKTSGATGMHIFLPLGARYSYDQAREFAELICVLTNRRLPDITSLARDPKVREKRVYLDYLQNRKGATVAAPYSLRPRRGAPVSMPLRWSELKQGLRPEDFNIQNTVARVKNKGDLWKPLLDQAIDIKTALRKLKALVEG